MKLHKRIEKRMRENKWEENYIKKTLEILKLANSKKHPYIKILDNSLIWIALVFSLFGNFVVSIAIAPMILILPNYIIIIISIIFGICFGILIDLFIRDIDIITHHHYIIAGIFLPCISIINIYIISNILTELSKLSGFSNFFPNFNLIDLQMVIIVYVISFLLPHSIYKSTENLVSKNV